MKKKRRERYKLGLKLGLSKENLQTLSVPAIGIAATFFAYGTQARLADFSLLETFIASGVIYAIPAQLLVVEPSILTAPFTVVFAAVLLVNLRLTPMTMAALPLFRTKSRLWNIVGIHFVALTTWLVLFQKSKEVSGVLLSQFYFFLGFSLWSFAVGFSLLGYYGSAIFTENIALAFVFLNPLYFFVLLFEQCSLNRNSRAIIWGTLLLPFFYAIDKSFGMLLAGVVGGSIAFFLDERERKKLKKKNPKQSRLSFP